MNFFFGGVLIWVMGWSVLLASLRLRTHPVRQPFTLFDSREIDDA